MIAMFYAKHTSKAKKYRYYFNVDVAYKLHMKLIRLPAKFNFIKKTSFTTNNFIRHC